ncbi:MAG: AAA family ATPase, partial [Woeseiaceae bacterium]
MYTDFFGLTQRPFGSNAVGDRVYIGPQQVKIISTLGNALSGDDTVVTLSGRVGSGKTTVINRVLESVASKRAVARIGRLQLGPDEVLELLLTEFGVTDLPPGTIQRYNAFKNLLKDWAQSGTRSFIMVEDAKHAGLDALLELEAITASDAGDSPGACILLMGGLDLDEFLQQPQLDRMRQRLRRRTTLEACSESEVHGYLAH